MTRFWTRLAILPVLVTVLWHVMDTEPLLWLYDALIGPSSLHNQTIMITGASSGIGAALVCELAAQGAQHIVLAARRVELMHEVVEQCSTAATSSPNTQPTTFSVVHYDALVEDESATQEMVQRAIESTPRQHIDVLVLNSGIYQLQRARNTSAVERRRLMRVNYEAPVELAQEFLQTVWKSRQGGQIVVVASIMSLGPHSLCSTYAATKAALRSYFQTLSTEEPWLKVNVVLPGGTASDMWKNSPWTPDAGALVTTTRVARLTATIMTGPTLLFYQATVSKASGLLYAFLSHYTPALFYWTNHLAALARMAAYDAYQQDLLELPSLVTTLFQVLMGRTLE